MFEEEPPDPGEELLTLDNVILSPHALCWTDECFIGMGRQACRSIVDVAACRAPRVVVDCGVLDVPRFRSRLETYAEEANR